MGTRRRLLASRRVGPPRLGVAARRLGVEARRLGIPPLGLGRASVLWRLWLRLGLSLEGIFRQASVYKGRNRDTAWYAAIDSEWPALRACFETWLDEANFDNIGRQRTSLTDLTIAALRQSR